VAYLGRGKLARYEERSVGPAVTFVLFSAVVVVGVVAMVVAVFLLARRRL
jgi:hypothetical protein